MKFIPTALLFLIFVPFMVNGQILDFELGVLDFEKSPYFTKALHQELVIDSDNIFLITRDNGEYDLLHYYEDSVRVIIQDEEGGLEFLEKNEKGFFFTRGSGFNHRYLFFYNHASGEMMELYEFEENLQQHIKIKEKIIFSDWTYGLFASDGTLEGTILLHQFESLLHADEIKLTTDSFFFARVDDELWRTDGTVEGTKYVDDLPYSGFEVIGTGEKLIYYSKNKSNPNSDELWRTDGINPPVLITDIGVDFKDFKKIIPTEEGIYFLAESTEHGLEFWSCGNDETEAKIVLDIMPGPESGISDEFIYSFQVTTEDNITFFRAGGTYDSQIWKTDGTTSGTNMVIDFEGIDGYENFLIREQHITHSEDDKNYFFVGNNSGSGQSQLWVHDASKDSISFVKDFGAIGFTEFEMTDSKFYFQHYDQGSKLWVTDGTSEGTQNIGTPGGIFNLFGSHHGRLYITQHTSSLGKEIFITDGTADATLLKDINNKQSSNPDRFFKHDDQVFFYARDHIVGESIYTTDGSLEGTKSVIDFYPNTFGSNAENLKQSGGKLYFSINDSLWVSDGTVQGAMNLHVPFDYSSAYWGETSTHLYFTFEGDLYATDGTVEGTYFLLQGANFFDNDYTDFNDWYPAVVNESIYFFYETPQDGIELYTSNGTPGGTYMVYESLPLDESIYSNFATSSPIGLGDRIYFSNTDDAHGKELWISDGTAMGTQLYKDMEIGDKSSSPKNLVTHNNRLYFQTYSSSESTYKAWVMETNQDPTLFSNTNFDTDGKPASIGKNLFYLAGNELWKTDGTPQGTEMILENSTKPFGLTSYGNRIVFGLEDVNGDVEPWISDGTTSGTFRLKDVDPEGSSNPTEFAVIQNVLFFPVDTLNYGPNLLWLSEGSSASTKRTPFEREEISGLKNLTKLNNRLYFEANGSVFREEIYYLEFDIPVKKVEGIIFQDENGNKIQDADELGMANVKILAESDEKFYTYTDVDGKYAMFLPENNYILKPISPICSEITTDSISYNIDVADELMNGLDFGMNSVQDSQSLRIDLSSAITRCGFTIPFWINITNNGCDTASTKIILEIDSSITYIESDVEPDLMDGYTLSWNLDPIEIGDKEQIKMLLMMPDETYVGDTMEWFAESFIWDADTLKRISDYNYRSIISCAIDPNDKQVSPDRLMYGDENYTLADEKLTYQIRFQNTGNDTAFTVRVIDTLSSFLDYSSFEAIAASHPYQVTLSPNGVLDFVFENILLPDSTTNEEASHGFILFEIRTLEEIPEFTEIKNTAFIYFDFNSAIVTNTTGSTIVSSFDMDNDGVEIWYDCDDMDPNVGFVTDEVPYNGIDDDCDPLTLDDDLDGDGFLFEDDCDDNDADVNPDAMEIPNNGIDEDCDGQDLIVGIEKWDQAKVIVQPNPNSGLFKIVLHHLASAEIELRAYDGSTLLSGKMLSQEVINMSHFPSGTYFLFVKTDRKILVEKIVKID